MFDKYYYLVASLPNLAFGEPAPISRGEFLSECRKWLNEKTFNAIALIDINVLESRKGDSKAIKGWKSFDLLLRQGLAKIRQAGKEGVRERIPVFFKDVYEERTPLLMERRIQKKRWDFLEEEEFGHHFDIHILTFYFLKLQILERLAAFKKEKGKGVFEELCEVRYEQKAG